MLGNSPLTNHTQLSGGVIKKEMTKQKTIKTCFVISPIGEEGSETRERSGKILNHIIKPVVKKIGYNPVRADEISEPGIITSQIIQHLIDDDLVIADLTGHNPNVFYELAVRHAIRQPVVQIIQKGERIPFDVAGTRTIQLDHCDLDSVAQCEEELEKQIRSVEKDPREVDSPISIAIDIKSLRQSDDPMEKNMAEITSILQDIYSMVSDISGASRPRLHPQRVAHLFSHLDNLAQTLSPPLDREVSRADIEEAQRMLYEFIDALELLAIDTGLPSDMVKDFMDCIRQYRKKKKKGTQFFDLVGRPLPKSRSVRG